MAARVPAAMRVWHVVAVGLYVAAAAVAARVPRRAQLRAVDGFWCNRSEPALERRLARRL